MEFREFFNPRLPEHLEAYIHVQDKGHWPEGFIPEDTNMMHWERHATYLLSKAFIEDYQLMMNRLLTNRT